MGYRGAGNQNAWTVCRNHPTSILWLGAQGRTTTHKFLRAIQVSGQKEQETEICGIHLRHSMVGVIVGKLIKKLPFTVPHHESGMKENCSICDTSAQDGWIRLLQCIRNKENKKYCRTLNEKSSVFSANAFNTGQYVGIPWYSRRVHLLHLHFLKHCRRLISTKIRKGIQSRVIWISGNWR